LRSTKVGKHALILYCLAAMLNPRTVADLFIIVFRAAVDGTAPHGREGYYFGENGEYRLIDAAKVYTKTLHEHGKSKSPDPVPFTSEEAQKYFGVCNADPYCLN